MSNEQQQCRWCPRWFPDRFRTGRHEDKQHKLEFNQANGTSPHLFWQRQLITICALCHLPILDTEYNSQAHKETAYCKAAHACLLESDCADHHLDEDADFRPDTPIFDVGSREEAKLDDAEDASSQPVGQETGTSSVVNGASSGNACCPLFIEEGRVVLLSIVSELRRLKAQSALPTGTSLPKNFTGPALYRLHAKSLSKSDRTTWGKLNAEEKDKWTQLASDSSDVGWDFYVVHDSAVETGRHDVDMDAAVVLYKARLQSFDAASSSEEQHAVLNVTAKEVWLNAHWLSDKDVRTCGTVSSFTHRRSDLDCIFVSGPAPSKTRPRSATSAARIASTILSTASSFVMVTCVDIAHWSSLT
jgi:hypothetical protein